MIKASDISKQSGIGKDPLSKPQKAIVTDNKDPEFKRRIKVKIPGMFESSAPLWFSPESPTGFGDSPDAQRVEIPDIGSEVIVNFPYGDIHSGFYTSNWNLNPVPEEFRADYPNIHGFKDSSGTVLAINKSKKTFQFKHASGFEFNIKEDGSWSLTTPGAAEIDLGKALKVLAQLGNFEMEMAKFSGEVSDSVRTMSEDRVIYNGHSHSESIGTLTSVPIGSQ